MSELPDNWQPTPLGDVVTLRTGPFGSALHKADYVSEGVPLVNPSHIRNGLLVPDSDIGVSGSMAQSLTEFRLQTGDIVMGRRGEMGRCAVVPPESSGWLCGTGSVIVRPRSAVLSRYLWRFLSSPSTVEQLNGDAVGSTMVNLNQGVLLGLNIPVPPLNEQTRIADKLDAVLARVDACRDRLDRIPGILKRFRQSVLAAATAGKLTEDWRGGIPVNWPKVKLHDVGVIGRGKSKHRPRNDPRLFDGRYPFIQTGDVANATGIVRSHNQTYSDFGLAQSKLWPEGTLCITIAANIADTAVLAYPACFPDSVVGFVADASKCKIEYIKWTIDVIKDELERMAPATAQKNINLAILSEVVFALPPIEEQTEIVRRVESLFAFADRLEACYAAARAQVENLTPATLAKAFRGELVPQDPSDEPASVLLERIRAKRVSGEAVNSKRGRQSPKAKKFEATPC